MVELHPRNMAFFDDETLDMGLGQNREVLATKRRLQKCLGRIPAPARPLVHIEITCPLIVAPVEIVGCGNARFARRLLESIQHIPAHARLFHAPLAAGGVQIAFSPIKVFRFQEIGQDVVPPPALAAELTPDVVVPRLAAHIDHAVDGGAAAKHLATRIDQRAAVQPRLFRRLETPVGARIVDAIEITDWNMDPVVIVVAARFQQQHAVVRIFRKAVGENASGTPRSDDDIVIFAHALLHAPPLPRRPGRGGGLSCVLKNA